MFINLHKLQELVNENKYKELDNTLRLIRESKILSEDDKDILRDILHSLMDLPKTKEISHVIFHLERMVNPELTDLREILPYKKRAIIVKGLKGYLESICIFHRHILIEDIEEYNRLDIKDNLYIRILNRYKYNEISSERYKIFSDGLPRTTPAAGGGHKGGCRLQTYFFSSKVHFTLDRTH